MPNWCHNSLMISGNPNDVEKFLLENQGEDDGKWEPLLFSKSVPEPDFGDDSDEWYNWRVENWGTKWDPVFQDSSVKSQDLGETVRNTTYNFDTAWGPADVWLSKVAKKYPELRFCMTYGEPGQDFGGILIYLNGRKADESYGSASDYLGPDMLWF